MKHPNLRLLVRILTSALAVFFLTACDGDDDRFLLGNGSTPTLPPTSASALRARLEVPALKGGNLFLAHWSVEGGDSIMTYCFEYDPRKFHSRWVAFRFDGRTRAKNVGRKDYGIKPQYPADPLLPAQYAIEDDARFSGYQHGHLCASADRLYSRTANDNTFYMTNMSPMMGRFNSPYWSAFEELVQTLGRDRNFSDTLYVVKGGTIADGQVREYVAGNRMPVPRYYFMALLSYKNGVYNSIAFWMEHKDYGTAAPDPAEMRKCAVSVDRLEELTGIDFFHNLPDYIENRVESVCFPAVWVK